MSSREKILNAVAANQPELLALPVLPDYHPYFDHARLKFEDVLAGIGASVVAVSSFDEIRDILRGTFDMQKPVFSTIPELTELAFSNSAHTRVQELHTIELMILPAQFGVAENGAVWLTDNGLPERALPFIPEHLAVVLPATEILNNMHEAYARIGNELYGWAAFIAGPSKTADIEQSLVLGAHGPRSMTVFLLS